MSDLAEFKRKIVAIKDGEKDPLIVLEGKVAACADEVKAYKIKYAAIKKLLDGVETDLINAKEAKHRAEESLEIYRQTRVIDSSLDDFRDAEVAAFREVMPACMEKIAHELPLRYTTISELDTLITK